MPTKAKPARTQASASPDFNHAMIYVRELAPALHFYRDLLGVRLIEEFGGGYARLRTAGGTIALHRAQPGEALDAPGVRLYFETRNLDGLCKTLQAAGVTLTQAPKLMPWGWRHTYLNDPDGHEVSLYWAGRKRFQKSVMPKR